MNTGKHGKPEATIPADLKKHIRFIYHPVNVRIRPLRLLCNYLFSGLPYNAVRFHKRSFAAKLEDLLRKEKFDLIQLEGLYLKWYINKHEIV